jgi:3-deoxy-7-phosphoheptulonate synthase
MRDWSPESWQAFPALQQPKYPDPGQLAAVVAELSHLPPLVTSWEVARLREQLAEAARGERFVLQGGDCAEQFDECRAAQIAAKLKILLQISLVLVQGSQKPVIRIGRFAGQYAKPRSADYEVQGGLRLPSYRGDLVNRPEFTVEARTPDPTLMLRGYERAALTLNFVRALVKGGFADLHHPEYWDLEFVRNSPLADEYHRIVATIGSSLQFMENILGIRAGETDRIDFFTAHEALLLPYEQAQTRTVPRRMGWYNLSTHFPWIGARTASPGGAHVEYVRGIANPVGVKVSAATAPADLSRLIDILDPGGEPGRLSLIHRFGHDQIASLLPPLIDAAQRSGKPVIWICDPMHGNTKLLPNGIKTRYFEDILSELEQAFDIHRSCGSRLGGVHIELTGENVTECVGGAGGLTEQDLARAYRSGVDPRLNADQALEVALLIAHRMSAGSSAAR